MAERCPIHCSVFKRHSQHVVLLGLSGQKRPEPWGERISHHLGWEEGGVAQWTNRPFLALLPCGSGEGTNARVTGGGLVCSGRCLAACTELVWLEEVRVFAGLCGWLWQRRPTGLPGMRAMPLDPQAALRANGLAPRAARPSFPSLPPVLRRQGNWS